MKRLYFGTDGVRGPYGGPLVNEVFFARLAAAAVKWLQSPAQGGPKKGNTFRVLIGRDTRGSGLALEHAVACGLNSVGAQAISLGVLPTPAVPIAVMATDADLGIVITASHNAATDNGIKFFDSNGRKLSDADESAIEQQLGAPVDITTATLTSSDAAIADYIGTVRSILPPKALADWCIVLDTANGAACFTSPVVLRSLGAKVVAIGGTPDGTNINAGVGSEYPQTLAQTVLSVGAQLGIAHDGDGDRCVLCDEKGVVLDGDEILTILALHTLKEGKLANKILVVTVHSNIGVDAAVSAEGGQVLRTSVGDRYVIERMIAEGASLGGESSGHIICADVSKTGDGLVAALKVLEVMLATGLSLSQLRTRLRKYPQATSALRVVEKLDLVSCPSLSKAIVLLQSELAQNGRVLVRYSGTEPKIRLLVEGPDSATVNDGIARLESAVRLDLEVL